MHAFFFLQEKEKRNILLQKFPKHFCEDYSESQKSKILKETKLHEQNQAGMNPLKCQILKSYCSQFKISQIHT